MQYILNTKPSFLTVQAMSFWEKTIAKQSAVTLEKRRANGDLTNFFQAVGVSIATGRPEFKPLTRICGNFPLIFLFVEISRNTHNVVERKHSWKFRAQSGYILKDTRQRQMEHMH